MERQRNSGQVQRLVYARHVENPDLSGMVWGLGEKNPWLPD